MIAIACMPVCIVWGEHLRTPPDQDHACAHNQACLLNALTAEVKAHLTLHAAVTHGCSCSSINRYSSLSTN